VPVGFEVARALGAPLHAFVVRKLGAPGNPELAIGALASDGTLVRDDGLIAELGVDASYVAAEIARQEAEIARRRAVYGSALDEPPVEGRTVILVDDGIATGSTVRAALSALRARGPAAIVLAVPVGSRDVLDRLAHLADRVVAVERPEYLLGVGAWYDDFAQTSDEDVLELLRRARRDG
jgi:putative phosphoribosyl transferase